MRWLLEVVLGKLSLGVQMKDGIEETLASLDSEVSVIVRTSVIRLNVSGNRDCLLSSLLQGLEERPRQNRSSSLLVSPCPSKVYVKSVIKFSINSHSP